MGAMLEVIVSVLCVWGLICLLWLTLGRLLSPVGSGRCVSVIPARGDAGELEQSVRGLVWLRCAGLASGAILICDRGLTPGGLALAQALCRAEPGVMLCRAEDLEKYL